MNLTERDPNYKNPYRKQPDSFEGMDNLESAEIPKPKPKKPRKPKQKGPSLSGVKIEL